MSDKQLLKSLLTLLGRVKADGNSMPDHMLSNIKNTLIKVASDDNDNEDEFKEGFSIVDDPEQEFEGDDADKWLKEQKAKQTAPKIKEKPKSKSGYTDWAPSEYDDKQKAEISKHIKSGFSPREAERLAGAHKGPLNFQSALTHTVKPSQISEKMLDILKPMAKDYLDRATRHEVLHAEAEKNPTKYAEGKMIEAFEQHQGDKQKAFNEFINSNETKSLKGREKHKAVTQFHKDWTANNPKHEQNISKLSEASQSFKEADETRKKSLQDRLEHIMGMGRATEGTVSVAEGVQHVGGVKTEEGIQATTIKDPAAKFAETHGKKFTNPEFVSKLKGIASPKQMERWQRVSSAKKIKGSEGNK